MQWPSYFCNCQSSSDIGAHRGRLEACNHGSSANYGKTLFAVVAAQVLVRRQLGCCAALRQKKRPLEARTRTAAAATRASPRWIQWTPFSKVLLPAPSGYLPNNVVSSERTVEFTRKTLQRTKSTTIRARSDHSERFQVAAGLSSRFAFRLNQRILTAVYPAPRSDVESTAEVNIRGENAGQYECGCGDVMPVPTASALLPIRVAERGKS